MARCTATSKQSGERCKRQASPGQTTCTSHGSRAPQNIAAAERRIAEAQAVEWMLKHIKDAAPMASLGDVYEELLAVGGTARAMRQVMQQRVSELQTTGYQGVTGEQVKADVVLLERALDRSAKVSELIARLNLDERIVRHDEARIRNQAEAVQAGLEAAQLSEEQRTTVIRVMLQQLRTIEAGGDTE